MTPISDVLRQIVLAPQWNVDCSKVEIKYRDDLLPLYLLAHKRLSALDHVPPELQQLMLRVQECVYWSLQVSPVIKAHVQGNLERSEIDDLISLYSTADIYFGLFDLFFLFASDYGTHADSSGNRWETVTTFYEMLALMCTHQVGTQAKVWNSAKFSTLPRFSKEITSEILEKKEPVHIPVGLVVDGYFCKSLLLVDYHREKYRLRLLTVSGDTAILPAGKKPHHYCPEVVWEGLTIEQLTDPSIWKCLQDMGNLTEEEAKSDLQHTVVSFDALHLIPWLTSKLGKRPKSIAFEYREDVWADLSGFVSEERYSRAYHNITDYPEAVEGSLLLRPTGKEIKRSSTGVLRKFVNLLPMERLPDRRDFLLYKAESRLAVLVGAYLALKEGRVALSEKAELLRFLELSMGKVTKPVVQLMELKPDEEQREAAKTILASIVDLKHRLSVVVRRSDKISLASAKPLYPSVNRAQHLDLSGLRTTPPKPTFLDTIRLGAGIAQLPLLAKWSADDFPAIYASLEEWYGSLLDAKFKCEPVEILMLAHRNVFSRLPIPSAEPLFQGEISSEGLLMGTLVMLKKISSLVASEVYTMPMVPPLFIADTTRVYRICVELYRHFNPAVRDMPISWYCLHQYLHSRHSFHMPGEVRDTLLQLEASFKALSPEGHLRPSDNYREIPLFYYCWKELPETYRFYRKELGPFEYHDPESFDELLTKAELADSIGIPAADIGRFGSSLKWKLSFGGQCVLLLEEIALHYTMSIFGTSEAYRKELDAKWVRSTLQSSTGPEDHFKLLQLSYIKYFKPEYSFSFALSKEYTEQVQEGRTHFDQQLVRMHNPKLGTIISDIPVVRLDEWQGQAELIRSRAKQVPLHQAAAGPSDLSIAVLLEYFESRPSLLLNQDYRGFFSAAVRSGDLLQSGCAAEPLLGRRLQNFLATLYAQDKSCENNLNFERLLWTLGLVRHFARIAPESAPLMKQMLEDLLPGAHPRMAPHLLAAAYQAGVKLPAVELAKLHLLVGKFPPKDPNDITTWIEASEAMQVEAPRIQKALLEGDESVWRLLFGEEASELMHRARQQLSMAAVLKTATQFRILDLKQEYHRKWLAELKGWRHRDERWRIEAHEKALSLLSAERPSPSLDERVESLFCYTPASLLVQTEGRYITVDWETGRTTGLEQATALPISLCKSPDLAILKQQIGIMEIDLTNGTVWLKGCRLLSQKEKAGLKLPASLSEGFSVWVNNGEGFIAAHALDGTPHPVYAIDQAGAIRYKTLRLAPEGYYSEAQIFSRWGLLQRTILVWLDEENRVAELHLPLHNGVDRFTRVTRSEEGWKVDGLDVVLVDTQEAVPAFAGHPFYLVAQNQRGQRVLLLPGATPYAIHQRYTEQNHEIDWNRIHVQGAEERIHQFRITPSGHVEGLTVADNLLLMLWTFYMGRYPETAAIAKRWISPPGRPYTDEEERLIKAWVSINMSEKSSVVKETHPSALTLRAFILVRIARHIKDFPETKLWQSFWGPRSESYYFRSEIVEKLVDWHMFKTQVRGTQFEELISEYDHEIILRLIEEYKHEGFTPLGLKLYQRQKHLSGELVPGATKLIPQVEGSYYFSSNTELWGKETFGRMTAHYPVWKQVDVVPVEAIYRQIVPVDLTTFFNRAYTLLKNGARTYREVQEYAALVHGIKQLRCEKRTDVCIRSYHKLDRYVSEWFSLENLLLWLILEKVHHSDNKEGLPELPGGQIRFDLLLTESKEKSIAFFNQLMSDPGSALIDYRRFWWSQHGLRYFKQAQQPIQPDQAFYDSTKTPYPKKLVEEIGRWSRLKAPLKPGPKKKIALNGWSYSLPPLEELQTKLEEVRCEREKREKALLLAANAFPGDEIQGFANELHYFPPKTIDECIGLALSGKLSDELHYMTLHFLDAALEEAHLVRIGEALNDPESLQEALKAHHSYLPTAEALPLMATEYYGNCRLRTTPHQAGLIDQLSTEMTEHQGTIIQAIMGSGKTQILAPAWCQMMLGTGRIPIFCVPPALFKTSLANLQNMMWNRFGTHVKALTFFRENCTQESLYRLAEMLYLGRQEPTVYVCTPRDLHALQLMCKERHQIVEEMRSRLKHYALEWARVENRKAIPLIEVGEWHNVPEPWNSSHSKLEKELKPLLEEADLLQSILNLLQHEAALLVDEVASVYDPRNMLSFPIGWQVPANAHAVTMGCKVYMEWLPRFFDQVDLLNNNQTFSTPEGRSMIYGEMTKLAHQEYSELLSDLPSLEVFTAYMFSDLEHGRPMEDYLFRLNEHASSLNRQLAQELAFLKYCLTSGLEGALTSKGFVNYGRSQQDPGLCLAIPYESSNKPKENTLFKRPWKTILMTCQLYLQGWKDRDQTKELLGFLQGIDPLSKDQEFLAAADKIWGPRFAGVDFDNEQQMQTMTDELDKARLCKERSQAARLLIKTYLRACVFPSQLKLDPSQLTSTPQDLPMIVAKADAMGGTFGFETTWNTRLKRVPDSSSDQTILEALERNQTCHVLPKAGVEALLPLLANGYMALIDAGTHFKGIPNGEAAKKIFESVKGGFDCVLYFEKEQLTVLSSTGLVRLEKSDREGVRRHLNQLKLKAPFVYYDHASCIGQDLELPEGRALVTFSDTVTRDDLMQGCSRCRLLTKGRHKVEFAIPYEMAGKWNGDRVVSTAKAFQKQLEKKGNFQGICEQMRGAARAIIDRAMRSTSDGSERHALHQRVKTFFLEEQQNDLVKTFGALQPMIDPSIALERLSNRLTAFLRKVVPGCSGDVIQEILDWHRARGTELPEKVREGDEQDDAVQETDLSKDQDRMRLMEEEYERMLGTRNPKKEIAWTDFNADTIRCHPLGSKTESDGMPTLYMLGKALQERGYLFPCNANVLITENLLTTFRGESNSLLTDNQKEFYRTLFVRGNLILLTEGDAHYLKEHLLKQNELRGVCLVEPSGVVNQRGCRDENIANLWQEGDLSTRTLLMQALLFQGAAMLIDSLPKEEVKEAIDGLKNKNELRLLFEAALEFKSEEMVHYRRTQKLRALFQN